jgi:hypothetical protein
VERNAEVIAYPAPCKLKTTPEIEVAEHLVRCAERKVPWDEGNRAWYGGNRAWYEGNRE